MSLFPGSDTWPGEDVFPGEGGGGGGGGGFVVEEIDYPSIAAVPQAAFVAPDLIDNLPPFEQDSAHIQNVLTVIGNELGRIEQARQDLISNFFPSSADALLGFFEAQLGLPVASQLLTLAQRQATVLTLMQSLKQSGTGMEWEDNVTALVGNNWTYEEHDPDDGSSPPPYTILVRIPYIPSAGAPAGLAKTTSSGSVPPGTYYYAVTGVTSYGETMISNVVSATFAGGSEVALTWDVLSSPALTGYNIYRGTESDALFKLDASTTNSYTDDAQSTPSTTVTPPGSDTSGSPQSSVADKLLRATTPAHIQINTGFSSGFLIGISEVGESAL